MATKKETFERLALTVEKPARRRIVEQIINENKAIALILVRRFRQQWDLHHLPEEDFEQAAFIGVMRAAESYRWGAGSTFSSWITDHVRQELQNLAQSMGYKVKRWVVPAAKIREMRAFETRMGRPPTAEEAGVTPKQLEKINEPPAQYVVYDELADDEDRSTSFGEDDLTEIGFVFDQLNDEESAIVAMLFQGDSEKEIAETLGKSRQDVSAVIDKVRGYFADT